MRYRCLIFDHDDTAVNSTATIHHPAFLAFLREYFPGRTCTLEDYFLKNFEPGFIEMCVDEYGMTDRDLETETNFWLDYVKNHVPEAYPGIPEIFKRTKEMFVDDKTYSEYGIQVEHFIVSTGFAELIRGSELMPYVDGVWGCELLDAPDKDGDGYRDGSVGDSDLWDD